MARILNVTGRISLSLSEILGEKKKKKKGARMDPYAFYVPLHN